MKDIPSISTSSLSNPFCQARIKNGEAVCAHCYAQRLMNFRPSLQEAMARNTEILTKQLITKKEAKEMLSEAGISGPELSFKWLYDQPEVTVVLSGMNSEEMVEENVRIAEDGTPGCMTEKDRELTEKIRSILNRKVKVGCTGCRYCVLDNDCPRKIQIPELFSCYNLKTTFHNWNQDYYYENILTRDHGKASDCLKCGKCERICPQHLPIRELLEQVAGEFEGENA